MNNFVTFPGMVFTPHHRIFKFMLTQIKTLVQAELESAIAEGNDFSSRVKVFLYVSFEWDNFNSLNILYKL
jgi:hypothetical protein